MKKFANSWKHYNLHLDEEMDSRVHFKFSRRDENKKKTYVEEYVHFDEVSLQYNIKVISIPPSNVFLVKIITDGETDRGGMKWMEWAGAEIILNSWSTMKY